LRLPLVEVEEEEEEEEEKEEEEGAAAAGGGGKRVGRCWRSVWVVVGWCGVRVSE